MTDKLTYVPVICQGGLDTTQNHLLLDAMSPGAASRLVNYEIGIYGGYRRIEGYESFDADYPDVDPTNAEGPILGVFIFKDATGVETIIAARKQIATATYKFYYYTGGVGWTAYAPGFTLSSTGVLKIRKEKYSFGGVNYIQFVDGVNYSTLFDGTTWYQLEAANTGTSGSPGGDQLIDAPKYITIFKNHIFLTGDLTNPTLVVHSAPTDPFNYTAAAGGGQLITGFPTNGIKPFRDTLYVWGFRNIKNITTDGTSFLINDTANNIGCIAPDSIQEINGDIIFLAQDGIRNISGTAKIGDINLAAISKSIQSFVNDLQEDYDLTYLDSVVIKKKSQFRYFINDGTVDTVGTGIIGGIRGSGDGLSWEFGELSGIRTSCVENDYYEDQETILHGDYDGNVYIQESGNSFNGEAISSIYATPFLTFGNPILRKQSRKVQIFMRSEGIMDLNLGMAFDWNNPNSLGPVPFTGSIGNTPTVLYDSGTLYDSGALYPTEDNYANIDLDIEGSFKSVQLTFYSTSDNDPHTIHGFVFDFTPQATR